MTKENAIARLQKAVAAHLEEVLCGGLQKSCSDAGELNTRREEIREEMEFAAENLVDLVLQSPALSLSEREVLAIAKAAELTLVLCTWTLSDPMTDDLKELRVQVFERQLLVLLHGL